MSETGRAFTLIEVMITVTILAIGMIGVIRGYATMVNTLSLADYSIEGVSLLKEQMFEVERKAIEEGNILSYSQSGMLKGEHDDFGWRLQARQIDTSIEYDEETGEYEETNKDLLMVLNEAKVTVFNENVTPPRRFTTVVYIEGYEKLEPVEE